MVLMVLEVILAFLGVVLEVLELVLGGPIRGGTPRGGPTVQSLIKVAVQFFYMSCAVG